MVSLRAMVAVALLASSQAAPESFAAQLRCPFAKVWLEHGADRAAEILGVTPHRRLAEEKVVFGSCTYRNNFANADACVEFVGDSWTSESAKESCDNIMQGSTGILGEANSCVRSDTFAGWCSTNGGTHMALMELGGMSADCNAVANACTTWSNGEFVGEGECASAGETGGSVAPAPSTPQVSAADACAIAPGPMGAAHMHGMSPGYSFNCEGTPAQQSPYMWPLMWSAHVESQGLAFGSDVPTYHSKGKVMYMTDKNWKRLDMWYQSGIQRAIGQGPCDNPGEDSLSCNRTFAKNTTILHRGTKMSFIEYSDNGSISDCYYMDLGIIGNVRPDWFMDKRGDATDVQYLGDVHIYYMGQPKLVKQWRKKDFANQYFTMSMQGNPGEDGRHWPLTLNVPGEGFGDDFLQHYSHHELLTEEDTELFLIDDAFVAAGGSCPQVGGGEGSGSGPPTGLVEHVPSNLEVDQASWRSIEYTLSPVREAAVTEMCSNQVSSGNGMMRVTDEVSVQACFDSESSTLTFTAKMKMATAAWAAISLRETEECLMTPRGGGDAESVLALPNGSAYGVHVGPLSPKTKRFEPSAVEDYVRTMTPMEEVSGMAGTAKFENGELHFSFARKYDSKPESFWLNYAMGHGPEVSFHKSRGCFELKHLPQCLSTVDAADSSSSSSPSSDPRPVSENMESSFSSGGRRLLETVYGPGAVLTAFGLGSLFR